MTPAPLTPPEPSHLQAALDYAARGWAVFPLFEPTKTGPGAACSCGAASCAIGKHPRSAHGHLDATTDPAIIRAWWGRWPSANIGIATGVASGIVVVDVDGRSGGPASLRAWESKHGPLPATLTSLTGGDGGGWHAIYQGTESLPKRLPGAEGVDLKGEGGYIVAPPSLHHTGRRYAWDVGQPDDPAPLPDALRALKVEPSSYQSDPNAEVTKTALYRMFQAAGRIIRLDGLGKVLVRCPWEHEHSDTGSASSTIIFASGVFHCSHGHCDGRNSRDAVEWIRTNAPLAWIDEEAEQIEKIKKIRGISEEQLLQLRPSLRRKPTPATDGNKRLVPTPGNLALVLAHDPAWGQLRLDTLAGMCRWTARGPIVDGFVEPVPGDELADHHAPYVAQWLLVNHGVIAGIDTVHQALETAAAQHAYDPLHDYLRGIRWDGTERVTRWLTTYLGVVDCETTRLIARKWLISAVARGLDHGCQADHVLVLEGPHQGEGKSRALRTLAGDYFGTLPSLRDQVRAASAIRGRWIVEIGELDAIRGLAATATKDFLTQQSDRFRPAYARREVTAPRSCVFAGTTNEQHYLEDPTGNRRYWPVTVQRLDLPALARDRDQLWAEAVELYQASETWWPETDEERALLRAQTRERQEEDPWTDPVLRAAAVGGRTTLDIVQSATGITADRVGLKEQKRVAAILQFHGFHQSRPSRPDGTRGPRVWSK